MEEALHDVTRRDALKAGAAGLGVATAGSLFGMTMRQAMAAEDVPPAIGHIEGNPEKCSGCRTCMTVCALKHGAQCGPDRARLQIHQTTIDLFNTTMLTCKQCETPMCYYACQTKGGGAMYIDETTGARVIDQEKCIGCKMCVQGCPQDPAPIFFNEETSTCFKCDLCGGEPQCIKYCPLSATWSEHVYPPELHPLKFVQA